MFSPLGQLGEICITYRWITWLSCYCKRALYSSKVLHMSFCKLHNIRVVWIYSFFLIFIFNFGFYGTILLSLGFLPSPKLSPPLKTKFYFLKKFFSFSGKSNYTQGNFLSEETWLVSSPARIAWPVQITSGWDVEPCYISKEQRDVFQLRDNSLTYSC